MNILNFFRRVKAEDAPTANVTDSFIRGGSAPASLKGADALTNTSVLRCVTLISNSIGMLPINLIENNDEKSVAKEHPVHTLLRRKPNGYQTILEFKTLMQLRVLIYGNAYARVVRSLGKPIALLPLDPANMEVKLTTSGELSYEFTAESGKIKLKQQDVLHIKDLSVDGITGKSRVDLAVSALEISQNAQTATARIFTQGMMAGGALVTEKQMSIEQYKRIKDSLDTGYSGSNNAGRWMVLENGLKPQQFVATASDSQMLETRSHQIEEIGRVFGVPRPLLMMDDTSWGSGIETLSILFVQYGLQYWFTAWEQAIERTLLQESEWETHSVKFNEKALLRGTMKDQSEFLAKALGSGGHPAWMTQNEAREVLDLPKSDEKSANELFNLLKGQKNEPDKTTKS